MESITWASLEGNHDLVRGRIQFFQSIRCLQKDMFARIDDVEWKDGLACFHLSDHQIRHLPDKPVWQKDMDAADQGNLNLGDYRQWVSDPCLQENRTFTFNVTMSNGFINAVIYPYGINPGISSYAPCGCHNLWDRRTRPQTLAGLEAWFKRFQFRSLSCKKKDWEGYLPRKDVLNNREDALILLWDFLHKK